MPTNLSPQLASKLKQLSPGTYCIHKSWGFGQVKEWLDDTGQLVIDFSSKRGHIMDAKFCAESLIPVASDHILVQKSNDLAGLKALAETEPDEIVRRCIKSLAEGATADGIQAALSPDIVPAEKWKKWWESVKRTLRKDGHFYIPTRKGEALRVLDDPSAMGDKALKEFRAAVGHKNLLATLAQLLKFWEDIKSDDIASQVVATLNDTMAKMPRTKMAPIIDMALARDEFLKEAGLGFDSGVLAVNALLPNDTDGLARILEEMSSIRQGKLLEAVRRDRSDTWAELFLGLLPRAGARAGETIVQAFVDADRVQDIVDAVNRLLRERNVTCDFLHWFCKTRLEIFAPLLEPNLLLTILAVLEKDQLSDIKRGTKLEELLFHDKELIAALLRHAAFEDVRDITRAILLSPVFDDLDERSLLAQIIKLHPEVQLMVVGEKPTDESTAVLIVSWASLERKRADLEELIRVKIPANTQDLKIAREYGDLRENHEYKAAKEMKGNLEKLRALWETELTRAQGTDFADVDTSSVNVGTAVTLRDTATEETLVYSIVGAWDGDPSRGWISYQTLIAQSLAKRVVGDTVVLPGDGANQQVTIEKIERWVPPPAASTLESPSGSSSVASDSEAPS